MRDRKIHLHVNHTLERSAYDQFSSCCAEDFVTHAALMPDAHQGYVAPIGSVIQTVGAIVPSWVGYDIGCGMIAVLISEHKKVQDLVKLKAKELFDEVNNIIPMGTGGHNLIINDKIPYLESISLELQILNTHTNNKDLFFDVHRLTPKNLGTLGSGNHFIEILEYKDETWLVIHSGSRGVGHFVGTYFMKAASGEEKEFEATYSILDDDIKREYMTYQIYCLNFALFNRLAMADKVEKLIYQLIGFKYSTEQNMWTNKNHNHCIEVEPNVYLHRKGATSSELNERGVIPANMRDGCFLVEGLGNPDFLNSSSHGAGRALSRTEAKKHITLEKFQNQMQGIVAPVNNKTIDESPDAYKDIFEVMELQKSSVKILKHLKPIINWKG